MKTLSKVLESMVEKADNPVGHRCVLWGSMAVMVFWLWLMLFDGWATVLWIGV